MTVGITLGKVIFGEADFAAAGPQGRVHPPPNRPFPNAAASFWPETNLFFGNAETSAITLQRQQARRKCSGNRRKAGVLRERTPLEPDVKPIRNTGYLTRPKARNITTALCQRTNIAASVGSYAGLVKPQRQCENRVMTGEKPGARLLLSCALPSSVSYLPKSSLQKLKFHS